MIEGFFFCIISTTDGTHLPLITVIKFIVVYKSRSIWNNRLWNV